MTLRHTIRHATGNPGGALPGAAVHAKNPDTPGAPRLRELLIDLVSTGSYQLVVNMDEVGFLDSTGLGVLVGGLKRVRAHDGSLDLVCTQQRILKILKITRLTEVFGIYATVGQAIAAAKGRR